MDQSLAPEFHLVLEEIIGYILWPDCRAQKAFMFYGPKRTGKGTMIRVFINLLGQENCSGVQIQELATNKFKVANLFGKMMNAFGDLPRTVLMDVGQFKALTGEDMVEGEKKFKDSFTFFNRAKLVYGANYLPIIKEYDDAYYGRWIILPFDNTVFGQEDASLFNRLTTPEELSGILNLGLKGLARLRANDWHFSTTLDFGKMYYRLSNPIVAFLEDRYEECPINHIPEAQLRQDYAIYAKEHKLDPLSSPHSFTKMMTAQTAISVTKATRGSQNNQVEVWVGLIKKPKKPKPN